ncbi:MAG: GNAT family N-acetyltransferase [Woeseiaceae bacterium]|nr:GNAT family N-acetyltransferase [Woeseia sp.]MBT8097544.1 GNAT family N-acetyltransferase [Woeseia sp.]NNL51313.1 GNAT family N-acetyltransferase [Woeseiaceae bacterium]
MTTGRNISTELYFGLTGLRQLESGWRDLERRVDKLAYFHAFCWYEAALKSGLIDETKTIFITASNGDELVGILPLQQLRSWKFFLPFDSLCFLDSPHMILRDAVLDRDWVNRVSIADLASWLRKESRVRWDTLACSLMPANGCLAMLGTGSKSRLQLDYQGSGSAIIPCSGTSEENLEHMSARFKRNLRRLKRKAEKIGAVSLCSYSDAAGRNAAIQKFINIEHSGWKGIEGGSIASSVETTEFYRNLASNEDSAANCRIHMLKIGDEYVAGQFGFVSQGVFHLLKIAYREEYADVGPGTVLLNLVIDEFSRSAVIKKINLVTKPAWSAPWQAGEESTKTIQLFNFTPGGIYLYCQTRLINFLRKARLNIASSEGQIS